MESCGARNAASFAVASIHPLITPTAHHHPTSQASLAAVPGVRDVHPQRRLTRALAWYDDKASGGGGRPAPAAGGGNTTTTTTSGPTLDFASSPPGSTGLWADPAAGGAIRKRPGRLTTRPTLGLAGRGDADVEPHRAARRALLAPAHPGVAAALHAPDLWARGITGAGVRVGIFDTGVKGDHPHIKNIR